MESTPHLERADLLKILALEPESYFGLRGFLARPWRTCEGRGGLRSGGEVIEGCIGEDGSVVDVLFD